MRDHEGPVLLDYREAGRLLNLGRSTIYRLIEAGELTPIHIGSRALIPRSNIDAFVARKTAGQ